MLQDIAAERGVLAGICQFGHNSFLDVADIINDTTFTNDYNKKVYACLKNLFKDEAHTVDLASIYSSAIELGLKNLFDNTELHSHIDSLFRFAVSIKNVRRLAIKIKKLEIARQLQDTLEESSKELFNLNGDESIAHIIGIAENAILDFSNKLNNTDEEPRQITDDLEEYVNYLAENPIDQIGIPTNFKEYNKAIGGGLRGSTVNVIAARSKTGKSIISSNIAYYIASELNIPVLSLDSEMTYNDHLHRLLAMASECYIYDIETGKFAQKPGEEKRLRTLVKKLKHINIPYYHKSISGKSFEEQLALMRRWIIKRVGLKSDGKANKCVLVYDYLKLTSTEGLEKNLQEYQLLGLMMTKLHDFAVRYDIPILMMLQTNRDGVNKEDVTVASGSDRILWLASNFTLLKIKADDEIDLDGPQHGNRKLVPILARHGGGVDYGNYINCHFNGAMARIVEGKTKFEVMKEAKEKQDEDKSDNS